MISLLSEKYPNRHYTGLDLTLVMIEQAKKKNILNVDFVVGDCERSACNRPACSGRYNYN